MRLKLLVAGLLALAGVLGSWWLRGPVKAGWQPLPGGGQARIHAVTHGILYTTASGRRPLRQRISFAVEGRSWRPLISQFNIVKEGPEEQPSMTVWVEVRGRSAMGSVVLDDPELQLPDGQTLRGDGWFWRSDPTGMWHGSARFGWVPYRARTLRFVATIDGQRIEFEINNPAFRPNLPVWKAAPLPQTVEKEGVALTLRSLGIEPARGRPPEPDWVARTEWSVTDHGLQADDWFDVEATGYEDAGGNVSPRIAMLTEPVWKVRAAAKRNRRYPFPDDEVRWLAKTGETSADFPAAETYRLLPRDKQALQMIGIFGPGQYEFWEGTVLKAGPLEQTGSAVTWDQKAKTIRIRIERPALIVFGFTKSVDVFRDERGSVAKMVEYWDLGKDWVKLTVYDLPDRAARFGLVDPAPLTFEFFVQPPAVPFAKAGLAPR